MILRIALYLCMVLMVFGFSIALEVDDWFRWIVHNYGYVAALAAITVGGFVLEAIIKLFVKLEKMTR